MSQRLDPIGRESPSCVAIVICNEVIEDKWTNNKTLVGLFNSIAAPGLPAHHHRMFIMVSLTDGRGEWPVLLAIEGRGLPLPEAGEYHVGLFCGGRPLASRRFTVVRGEG